MQLSLSEGCNHPVWVDETEPLFLTTHPNHRWKKKKCCFCLVALWHQLPNDPWYSMTQFTGSAGVAVWARDIMETISAEMLQKEGASLFCWSKKRTFGNEKRSPHCCLLPCEVRGSCVLLPLAVSSPFCRDVKSNCKAFFFPPLSR